MTTKNTKQTIKAKNSLSTMKSVKKNTSPLCENDKLMEIANKILTEHKKAFLELGKN